MSCLDDNLAVEFATGSLARGVAAKVEAHLAGCRDCRTLVAALAPAPGEPDSDIVTSPRALARGKRGHPAALSPTEPKASEPRRPLEPVVAGGDTIGRYIVLRRLGAGGMGVVYAAYDPQLDRKVALKLLRTGMGLGEGEARARLVREAQAIAQLSHPNVVAVYDVGTAASGEVYVAMEFVEGDTLTQWLARWDRPWRELLEIFREAGRGLAAAHAVGLLHRDFKPDNVLVGSDGRVRVTDFGLARSLVTGPSEDSFVGRPDLAALRVTLTATGAVMGTPRYMAPEQLRGGDVGAAADQFGFCVALYEALYGCHPIVGDTAAKMLEEGARARPPPDEGTVPAWIAPILLRGLDPHPARRFPSMAALIAELAPPAPSRSRRTYVAVLGAAALVLGGAAAATVIGPGDDSAASARIEQLAAEVQELMEQREHLLEALDSMRKQGELDQRRLNEVIAELATKTQRIEQLEAEIRQVVGDAAVVAAAPAPRRAPRLRPEGGVPIQGLRTTVKKIESDIAGCMREWVERKRVENPDEIPNEAAVNVQLRLRPDGRVQNGEASGLDDVVVPQCVVFALSRTPWPTSPDVTVANVGVRWYQGQITVTVERLGTEQPSPRSDIGGE